MHLQKSKVEAIERLLKMLKKAKSASLDPDIVCLPELWYPKPVTNFEEEFEIIVDAAKENNMTIIPGAFQERINGRFYISCPVIAANGKIAGRQFKVHPFGAQRRVVKAASKIEIFDSGRFKFGIGICYDIVFPEVSRALVRKGADLLFFPSKVRKEGINPWHMYIQVRALENRIPIAAPNVYGGNSSIYRGKSICVDFDYDNKIDIAIPKIRVGSGNEQIIFMNTDLKHAKRIRRKRFEGLNFLYDLL
jgi:predicted amidohydrolase